jgi:GH18 family chitinase
MSGVVRAWPGRKPGLCAIAALCWLAVAPALAGPFVSYWPAYRGEQVVAPAGLTHLYYAFATIDADGQLAPPERPGVLAAVRDAARLAGARPGLLVGGWNGGDDSAITAALGTADGRRRLARAITNALDAWGLSAVEIDWEYPDDPVEGEQLALFLQELATTLAHRDVSIGLSVPALGRHADAIPRAALAAVDVISVMAYDRQAGPHAGRDYFLDSLAYWLARGALPAQLAMGMPAYARPRATTFAELVAADPRNAYRDSDGELNWNGLDTVRWKTRRAAERGAGIMLWELGQDAGGPFSLARAMARVLRPAEAGGGPARSVLR